MEPYIEEIVIGLGTFIIVGVWGIIKNFFGKIKRMGTRIDDLETKLDHNTRSDEKLESFVNMMIEKQIKK